MKLVVLLSLVSLACSQGGDEGFRSLDTNKDGTLSLSELYAYYDNFDANRDGALTLQELIQKAGGADSPGLEAQFNFYDKMDGTTDQRVTRTAAVLAFQKALDANGKFHNISNM
ncbi:hypothetical protein C0Q70_13610 [Pomacea canaliculata]|uniref:EF-hand domain-containing protein n=1 Tax=Pomacea canaliculata TaxID=400727 RepID=A0A2T7NXQ9_POMCA|nr:hypothetical protein C0Q70_13610 [Pomacea canaliculata]